MRMIQQLCTLLMLMIAVTLIAGCTRGPEKSEPEKKENPPVAKAKHDSWWCDEHGLPESECWACNAKYARERKAKGDWCSKHDRPDSECFLCHPELKAKFAAQYEAKYGKKPPEPEDY